MSRGENTGKAKGKTHYYSEYSLLLCIKTVEIVLF